MKDRPYASYAIDWESEDETIHRTLVEARDEEEALELLEGMRFFEKVYEVYEIRKLR